MREGIQTDHEFQTGTYCDCDSCCQLCDYHYGLEDACILERHMHTTEQADSPPVDGEIVCCNNHNGEYNPL
jgi:hypothetical protein